MKQNRRWQNDLKRSYGAGSCTSVVCVLDVPWYVFRSCCQVWFSMPDMWPAVFILIGLFVNTDTFTAFRHFTFDKGQRSGEIHFKYPIYMLQTKPLRIRHCHTIKSYHPCDLLFSFDFSASPYTKFCSADVSCYLICYCGEHFCEWQNISLDGETAGSKTKSWFRRPIYKNAGQFCP